jgi:serine protease inhibitor
MSQMSTDRRLLLKASFISTLFGLISRPSFADILEVSKKMDRDASQLGNAALLSAQARLGTNLVRQLANYRKDGANIIVSPASLAAILSFVELGASETMSSAIHRTLGFNPAAKTRGNGDLKALRSAVAATIGKSAKDGPFVLANLLVFDPSTKPRQLALLALSGAGADVLVDDLAKPKTIERINEWVRQRTRDLIPSIIEESPEDLGLVAVNALYFKDRWKTPFDPARTRVEPFQPLRGNAVDVTMMHSPASRFAFRQDDHFIAAELPYANEDFRLVVVTTKSTPAGAHDFAAVGSWLGGQDFDVKKGEVGLPKLSLTAGEELLSPLDALGLRTARQESDSLSGFSSSSLAISRVVQKLELRLNEEGTEAAAATAVTTTRSISPDDYVKMIVDKPFIFALRDQRTGLFLFMGYIGAPQKMVSNKS